MEYLWSIVVGMLVTVGVYLLMARHIMRVLFGLVLLSNAINLAIFTAGRLTAGNPALIATNAVLPAQGAANSIPQALILTAIVIGFGLLVFALVLSYRAYFEFGKANIDQLQLSERDS